MGVLQVTFPVHPPRLIRRFRRSGFSVPFRLSDVMAPNKGSCLWVMSCQPSRSATTSSVTPFLAILSPDCASSKPICHWIRTCTPFLPECQKSWRDEQPTFGDAPEPGRRRRRWVRAIAESGHTALKTDPFPQTAEERATPYGFLSGQVDGATVNRGYSNYRRN